MKGKVIVIKRRGPVSGRPRCGRAYKRTGSRQFNSGSLPWQAGGWAAGRASDATKEGRGREAVVGEVAAKGLEVAVGGFLEVTWLRRRRFIAELLLAVAGVIDACLTLLGTGKRVLFHRCFL